VSVIEDLFEAEYQLRVAARQYYLGDSAVSRKSLRAAARRYTELADRIEAGQVSPDEGVR
jgi:hypothetical protein